MKLPITGANRLPDRAVPHWNPPGLPTLGLALLALLGLGSESSAGQITAVGTGANGGQTAVSSSDTSVTSFQLVQGQHLGGGVWTAGYKAAAGVDKDIAGGTETVGFSARYRAEVIISAPGESWELSVGSQRKGRLGIYDDSGNYGTSNKNAITGTLVSGGTLESGSLSVGSNLSLSNSDNSDGGKWQSFNDSSNAVITGFGNSTVRIDFTWNAEVKSVANFFGGDGATLEFGLLPTFGNIENNSSFPPNIPTNDGHNLTFSIETFVAPSVSFATGSITLCEGDPFTLTPVIGGDPQPTVTWDQINGPGSGVGPFYTDPSASLSDAGTYLCTVSNSAGTASASMDVHVIESPVVGNVVQVDSACIGTDVTFSASTPTSGAVIEWLRNGQVLEFGPMLELTNVQPEEAGLYQVRVKNGDLCPAAYSAPWNFEVFEPTAVVTPGLGLVCEGESITLNVAATGGAPFTYEWFKDFTLQPETGTQLTRSDVIPGPGGPSGSYWAIVTDAHGCKTFSNVVVLLVTPAASNAEWIGDPGEFWADNANWQQPGGLPVLCTPGCDITLENTTTTSLNNAVIDAMDVVDVCDVDVSGPMGPQAVDVLGSLTVSGQTTLRTGGLLRVDDGTVTSDLSAELGARVEGTGIITGEFSNSGEVVVPGNSGTANAPLTVTDTEAINTSTGTIAIEPAVGLLQFSEDFTNSGLVTVGANSNMTVGGDVVSSGRIDVFDGASLSADSVQNSSGATPLTASDGLYLAGGNVTVDTNSDLYNSGTGFMSGFGSVTGNVASDGYLDVPVAGETLSISGNLVLNPASLLAPTVFIACGAALNVAGNILAPAGANLVSDDNGLPSCTSFMSGGFSGASIASQGDVILGPGTRILVDQLILRARGDVQIEADSMFDLDMDEVSLQLDGFFFQGVQHVNIGAADLGSPVDFSAPAYRGLGELRVGPTPASVVLDNPAPTGDSAIYTRRLFVQPGASLDLAGATVYAEEVDLPLGSQVLMSGGKLYYGSLLQADPCGDGTIVGDCASLQPLPVIDCNGNGVSDDFDILSAAELDCNANGIPDSCDMALGLSLDLDANGIPDECQLLSADVSSLSAGSGGRQDLTLHAGPAFGDQLYLVAGSTSGTSPGLSLGALHLPLNVDNYGLLSIGLANQGPFENTLGSLDSNGSAGAAIVWEPHQVPLPAIGLVLNHAYMVLDVNGNLLEISNPVSLELLP